MTTPNPIKNGTWIELPVKSGSSRWAQVISVYEVDSIEAVYLDGDTPVKDDFQLVNGRWVFRYNGVSGFKIRDGANAWRDTLRAGPRSRIRSSEPFIEYLEPEEIVFLQRRSVEPD